MTLIAYFSEDCISTDRVGHRIADWNDQIKKGVEDVTVSKIKTILFKILLDSMVVGVALMIQLRSGLLC